MKMNELKHKKNKKCSKRMQRRTKEAQTRLPVYMSKETKENLQRVRIEIYNVSGKFVSLTQIVRDAIEDQLAHEKELIQKYKK